MAPTKVKILLVEDDLVTAYVIKDFLQKKDFLVSHCTNAEAAWQQFMKNIYHVCIIDILLAGEKDGIELATEIRQRNSIIPIIILSSKSNENEKIAAFKTGVDSYMTKPYNIQELEKRINVFLRLTKKRYDATPVVFKLGDLKFDYTNLTIGNDTLEYSLTKREADLLKYLCQHPDRLIQKNELLINLWGKDDMLLAKSLDVFITRLRKYIKSQNVVSIRTIHGQGYIFGIVKITADLSLSH